MAEASHDARGLACRWQALAEARLDHLTNLFETGRWRRYYSQTAFMENISEAHAAVETWRRLGAAVVVPANTAVAASQPDRPPHRLQPPLPNAWLDVRNDGTDTNSSSLHSTGLRSPHRQRAAALLGLGQTARSPEP